MIFNSEIYGNNSIHDFVYTDMDKVPLIDTIKITNELFGRIDIIVNRFYSGRQELVKHLMDFNRLNDPTEMKIGMVFKLPDFKLLQNSTNINELDDNNIPGVLSDTNSQVVNQQNAAENKIKNKTIAIPKLKIPSKVANYDNDSGIITY